jgi:hypothetical protein
MSEDQAASDQADIEGRAEDVKVALEGQAEDVKVALEGHAEHVRIELDQAAREQAARYQTALDDQAERARVALDTALTSAQNAAALIVSQTAERAALAIRQTAESASGALPGVILYKIADDIAALSLKVDGKSDKEDIYRIEGRLASDFNQHAKDDSRQFAELNSSIDVLNERATTAGAVSKFKGRLWQVAIGASSLGTAIALFVSLVHP